MPCVKSHSTFLVYVLPKRALGCPKSVTFVQLSQAVLVGAPISLLRVVTATQPRDCESVYALEPDCLGRILSLPLPSCVTLGKLFNVTLTSLPDLCNGDGDTLRISGASEETNT